MRGDRFWRTGPHPNCVNAAYYRCGGKLEQALADIAEAGFESVEIFDGELLEFERDAASFWKKCWKSTALR